MLTFMFTGANGTMTETDMLTSGMVGRQVKLEFSEEWNDLSKTAVFSNGIVTKDVMEVTDVVTIPREVLAKSMTQLYVGVYGISPDGETVVPTVWAEGPRILPGADPSGDCSTAPQLPVWAQLQYQMKYILDNGIGDGSAGTVTPQMYGAMGDGITDDTAAFQAAVDGAGRIYVPAGTYLINCEDHGDGTCGIVISGQREIVLDRNAVLKEIPASGTGMLCLHDAESVKLCGGTLQGDGDETSPCSGLRLCGSTGISVKDMTIRGFSGDGIILTAGTSGNICEKINVENCCIDGCLGSNMSIEAGSDVEAVHCRFMNAPSVSLRIGSETAGSASEGIRVTTCSFKGNGIHDILMNESSDDILISGCEGERMTASTHSAAPENIAVINSRLAVADIRGGRIDNCTLEQVLCYGVGAVYSGCSIDRLTANGKAGETYSFDGTQISSVNAIGSNAAQLLMRGCMLTFTTGSRTMLYGPVRMMNSVIHFETGFSAVSDPIRVSNLTMYGCEVIADAALSTESIINNNEGSNGLRIYQSGFHIPDTVVYPLYSPNPSLACEVVGCLFANHTSAGLLNGTQNILQDNIFVAR